MTTNTNAGYRTHIPKNIEVQMTTTTLPEYIPRFVYTDDPLYPELSGYYWIRVDLKIEKGPFKTIKGAKISYTLSAHAVWKHDLKRAISSVLSGVLTFPSKEKK